MHQRLLARGRSRVRSISPAVTSSRYSPVQLRALERPKRLPRAVKKPMQGQQDLGESPCPAPGPGWRSAPKGRLVTRLAAASKRATTASGADPGPRRRASARSRVGSPRTSSRNRQKQRRGPEKPDAFAAHRPIPPLQPGPPRKTPGEQPLFDNAEFVVTPARISVTTPVHSPKSHLAAKNRFPVHPKGAKHPMTDQLPPDDKKNPQTRRAETRSGPTVNIVQLGILRLARGRQPEEASVRHS